MALSTSDRPVSAPPKPVRISSPDAARLIVRLWVPPTASEVSQPERPVREKLRLLIEDVIGVPCEPVNGTGSLYWARISNSTDALIASRQLQFAVNGFRRNSAEPVAVSLAIDAGGAAENTASEQNVLAPDGIASLLSLINSSRPAQILLTPEICRQLSTIRGLALRSSTGRSGVQEYLWTSADELEKLQSEPALTLLTTSPVLSDSYRARKVVDDLPEEGSGNSGTVFGAIRSRPVLAAGILLVLLTAAGVFEMLRHRLSASPAGIETGVGSKPVPGLADQPPKSLQPPANGEAKATPSVPGGDRIVDASKPQPRKPLSGDPDVPNSSSGDNAAQPATIQRGHLQPQTPLKKNLPAHCTLEGPLDSWMAQAKHRRAQGEYPDAIRIFKEILACDPKNVTARQEVDKLQAAIQDSSDD